MKKLLLATGLVLAAAAPFATVAYAAPETMTVETGIGPVLAADNGMTLYTFRKDAAGVSNCNDACANAWPPFVADDGDAEGNGFTLITRKTGEKQWAKDGKALYFWMKDEKKGDTTGNGFKDLWDAARP